MYTLGLYTRDDQTIHIWLYSLSTPTYRDEKVLRHVYLHEWLHYLDHCWGCEAPKGWHNDLFDARIVEMGWDTRYEFLEGL